MGVRVTRLWVGPGGSLLVKPQFIRVLRKGDDLGDWQSHLRLGASGKYGLSPVRISRCFYLARMTCPPLYGLMKAVATAHNNQIKSRNSSGQKEKESVNYFCLIVLTIDMAQEDF